MGGTVLETLRSLYGGAAEEVPLLYGGSANPGNIAEFASQTCVHGALVGGAALKPDQFLDIARLTAEAKGQR
jgi:triosephosphate isomerase